MHRFDLGAWPRKKIQNNKKVTKVLYFPYLGGAPAEPIWSKNCMVGGLHYIITCAKFQIDIYRCYDFTGGRIFDFPINFFAWALQQCSANALRVINTTGKTIKLLSWNFQNTSIDKWSWQDNIILCAKYWLNTNIAVWLQNLRMTASAIYRMSAKHGERVLSYTR